MSYKFLKLNKEYISMNINDVENVIATIENPSDLGKEVKFEVLNNDDRVIKIINNIGNSICFQAMRAGAIEIVVTSVLDPALKKVVKVICNDALPMPIVTDVFYDNTTNTAEFTLSNYSNQYTVFVDYTWTKAKFDQECHNRKVKVPIADNNSKKAYVKVAYLVNDVKSAWAVVEIDLSLEIALSDKPYVIFNRNLQPQQDGLLEFSFYTKDFNKVKAVEVEKLWACDDKLVTHGLESNSYFSFKVEVPSVLRIYSIRLRGIDVNDNKLEWQYFEIKSPFPNNIYKFSANPYGRHGNVIMVNGRNSEVNPPTDRNDDIFVSQRMYFTYSKPVEYDLDTNEHITGVFSDGEIAGGEMYMSPGVGYYNSMHELERNLNVIDSQISGTAIGIPVVMPKVTNRDIYFDAYDTNIIVVNYKGRECYVHNDSMLYTALTLNHLCAINCLAENSTDSIFWGGSRGIVYVSLGDMIVNKNCAVCGVSEDKVENGKKKLSCDILYGFKLLRDTEIKNIDGSYVEKQGLQGKSESERYGQVVTLRKGDWIWLSNTATTRFSSHEEDYDYNDIITSSGQYYNGYVTINSYSTSLDIEEIQKNLRTKNKENENLFDGYLVDIGYGEDKENYAIDTERYTNIGTKSNYITNGYFSFNDDKDPVMLWSGNNYSVRKYATNIHSKNGMSEGNILAKMHQCYLVNINGSSDIKNSRVAQCCMHDKLNVISDLFLGTTPNLQDRHEIEDFYYIRGMFDVRNDTQGYFLGQQTITLCGPEWKHQQDSGHVRVDNNNVEDSYNKKFEEVLKSEENYKQTILTKDVTPAGELGEDGTLDDTGMVGYTSNVLSSFFPFTHYIYKRLESICAEKTGKPLDVLSYMFTSFGTNFAIYCNPETGYEIQGEKFFEPLYGVKVVKGNLPLYRRKDVNNLGEFEVCKQKIDGEEREIILNEGDWIWFNDSCCPKVNSFNGMCKDNDQKVSIDRNYITIVGISRGTSSEGEPIGQILIDGAYINAGLSNPRKGEITSFIDKLKKKFGMKVSEEEVDGIPVTDARHYNISTMALRDGSEPHLLNEEEVYKGKIEHCLCYNYREDLKVHTDDGISEVIPTGRLFNFISEYTKNDIKYVRIYFYSDKSKCCKYGYIQASGALLFNYDIRHHINDTFDLDGKCQCIFPVLAERNLYTSYGEYYGRTREKDVVTIVNSLNILQKKVEVKGSLFGGKEETVTDFAKLSENNSPTMSKARPDLLKITYFGYSNKFDVITYDKLNGYVQVDYSKNYKNKLY